MSAQTPSTELPGLRKLTPKEQVQRAMASACLSIDSKPSCSKVIWIGIFFDGTNNNMERDMQDNSHSNIAVLYNTHRNPEMGDYYPLYIPGVGTKFKEIGEMYETSDGKAKAVGGEARIHYAMIQVYNAVHRAVYGTKNLLVPADEALAAVRADRYTLTNLNNLWLFGKGKRPGFFRGLDARLKTAINGKRPIIKLMNISVFGFSRGSAQARAFSNWLLECCKQEGGGYTFCGIPVRFQFLGIFDTVASVGLADASPIGSGLMDWADGTMRIPDAIERTVHYVAAHEIRQNFPLSTGRDGAAYPGNCFEVVYPGAHSDVGGGYSPGDQGKALVGRAHMVSQVPLVNMYLEAMKSGVPLMHVSELKRANRGYVVDELQIAPTLAQRFQDYAKWSKIGAQPVESMLFAHMRLYWRWRLRASPRFLQLESFQAANQQDQMDLQASEDEFKAHYAQVDLRSRMKRDMPVLTRLHDVVSLDPGGLNEAEAAAWEEKEKTKDVPPLVYDFFDQHVHDSHASFRLLGPTSREETSETIKQVQAKQARGEKLNPFEQRVIAQHQAKPGSFPVMGDSDTKYLHQMTGTTSSGAVWLITRTRRESGSFLRRRRVFDKC